MPARTWVTALLFLIALPAAGQPPLADITQPGDPIIASSLNSPGSEGVSNAIDNSGAKFLIFDTRLPDLKPSGFVVTPAVGSSLVVGMKIQSANDAPERDPKTVTLEGSNDEKITTFQSGNWEMIATVNVPAFTARFQVQEFHFPNTNRFKSYRWTVTETQTANSCCMQVGEVELLGNVQRVNCSEARFLVQPVNQFALNRATATFRVSLNGPWRLQWLKNGLPIPGATTLTYTTEPVTAATETNVYAVQIVDCEKSQDVQALLFTPSSTRSIGINFAGEGGNDTPTLMSMNDLAGVHLQAWWHNALGYAGSLPSVPGQLYTDDGGQTTMTFTWASGGAWNSGTSTTTATDRLLNGLVGRFEIGDNTFACKGVPPGNHSLLVYSLAPALQHQTLSYTVGSTKYYMRVMTAEEYNRAPGYYRSSSVDPASPAVGNYVRFDNVQPDGNAQISLTQTVSDFALERPNGVNGLQLILNPQQLDNPPAISLQPQPTVARLGGVARLSVLATGSNLTYQWRKNGRSMPGGGKIMGAYSPVLSIANFRLEDEGVYNVAIFNSAGSVISKNVAVNLSLNNISDPFPFVRISKVGGTITVTSDSGTLQSALTVFGPWTNVSSAIPASHSEAASATTKFFRAIAP